MATSKSFDSDNNEYYSFERTLRELQITEDALRCLVSEGEIRAFRDGDKMRFRKLDVDMLKKSSDQAGK